ncbi:U32 family peptidase [Shewanella intestini]|uniref:Ubiquinone biosynthesis protein UbiV n=1 Tax=Shewanella intestini TaxID=2017544 RepID=A0ABS5HXL4_9GAMM|nr:MULTISPECIES: U32 family peptidase [Shewanella]MBR9726495.1 U32 family peptidase [Shewanella intestini]MRG34939.1 U32 family peptidase [Shewanella sp. XMDDZSB0408]
MKISLAPLHYCWSKQDVMQFYEKVATTNIDTIYLGETVCSRRRELKLADYINIAKMLTAADKQVVLSTMALIEAQSELTELKRYIDNGEWLIEANDIGAVQLAHQANLPFVCGPTINNYNRASLDFLHKKGMMRFVMPYELSKAWLEKVITAKPAYEVEVFGFGHIPLAHSARCFTAKHLNLHKDNCQTICQQYPKGLLVQTQENQPLLRLNGIQTQSAACINLSANLHEMQQMGIDYWRLSARSIDDLTIADALANNLNQQTLSTSSVIPSIKQIQDCNGYWYGEAGMKQHQPHA